MGIDGFTLCLPCFLCLNIESCAGVLSSGRSQGGPLAAVPFVWPTFLAARRRQQEASQKGTPVFEEEFFSAVGSGGSLPPSAPVGPASLAPTAGPVQVASAAARQVPPAVIPRSRSRSGFSSSAHGQEPRGEQQLPDEGAVLQAVQAAVRAVLGSVEDVPPDSPLLAEAGLDSLGAVELRNSLEAEMGVALPSTLVGPVSLGAPVCCHSYPFLL